MNRRGLTFHKIKITNLKISLDPYWHWATHFVLIFPPLLLAATHFLSMIASPLCFQIGRDFYYWTPSFYLQPQTNWCNAPPKSSTLVSCFHRTWFQKQLGLYMSAWLTFVLHFGGFISEVAFVQGALLLTLCSLRCRFKLQLHNGPGQPEAL